MTYLQIVQRFCRESGLANTISAVTGQSGEALRMCEWANSAWMDIQGYHQDWGWLRTSTSFVCVDGQASYTPAQAGTTNFGMWVRDSFRNYPTATGTDAEIRMEFMDYEMWRDLYQFGSNRTATSQPKYFTILPANKAIGLGPVPTADYTVTADYFTLPTELEASSDTPSLPTQYHMAIVYRAMMMYGAYEAAPEVYQRGELEFKRLLRRLENDYMPEVTLGGPLV